MNRALSLNTGLITRWLIMTDTAVTKEWLNSIQNDFDKLSNKRKNFFVSINNKFSVICSFSAFNRRFQFNFQLF